jgi:hypothetical protein
VAASAAWSTSSAREAESAAADSPAVVVSITVTDLPRQSSTAAAAAR